MRLLRQIGTNGAQENVASEQWQTVAAETSGTKNRANLRESSKAYVVNRRPLGC